MKDLYLIIPNPRSGLGDGRSLITAYDLDRGFKDKDVYSHIVPTSDGLWRAGPEAVEEDLRLTFDHYRDDIKGIVSVGGDGLTNMIINAYLNFFGVEVEDPQIPLISFGGGTGDSFARHEGFSKKVDEFLAQLDTAHAEEFKLGRFNCDGFERFFCCYASAGLTGEILKARVKSGKKGLPAYFRIGLRMAPQLKPYHMTFSVGSETREGEFYEVFTGLTDYLGNLPIFRGLVDYQDEGLNLMTVRGDTSKLGMIRTVFYTLLRNKGTDKTRGMEISKASEVSISAPEGEKLFAEFDGEPLSGRRLDIQRSDRSITLLKCA